MAILLPEPPLVHASCEFAFSYALFLSEQTITGQGSRDPIKATLDFLNSRKNTTQAQGSALAQANFQDLQAQASSKESPVEFTQAMSDKLISEAYSSGKNVGLGEYSHSLQGLIGAVKFSPIRLKPSQRILESIAAEANAEVNPDRATDAAMIVLRMAQAGVKIPAAAFEKFSNEKWVENISTETQDPKADSTLLLFAAMIAQQRLAGSPINKLSIPSQRELMQTAMDELSLFESAQIAVVEYVRATGELVMPYDLIRGRLEAGARLKEGEGIDSILSSPSAAIIGSLASRELLLWRQWLTNVTLPFMMSLQSARPYTIIWANEGGVEVNVETAERGIRNAMTAAKQGKATQSRLLQLEQVEQLLFGTGQTLLPRPDYY